MSEKLLADLKMIPKRAMPNDVSLKDIEAMAARVKNWGRFGPDDEIGTLNYVTPEAIAQASALVRRGKVFSLALEFGSTGPQEGWGGRFNPIHTMLATGTDAVAGRQDGIKIRYADDMITMPLQEMPWGARGFNFADPDGNDFFVTDPWTPPSA